MSIEEHKAFKYYFKGLISGKLTETLFPCIVKILNINV